MKKYFYLLTMSLLAISATFAQDTQPPTEIIVGTYMGETQPLRDFPILDDIANRDPRSIIIVPNISTTVPENTNPGPTIINNIQRVLGGIRTLPLEQNFTGASQSESGFLPPDPTGAVGPNHYVHSVNSLVKIFDKTGNLLAGPTSLGAFLGFGGNGGDPIVLYDQLADRWVVSEFGNGNNLAIGVSTTNDPTGTFNLWQFTFPGFPDYPHYGVWPDGYYGTVNLNGQTTRAFAMERDVMLAGGANPQIAIFALPQVVVNPLQVKSPAAANLLGTTFTPNTPGYITYLQDDGWSGAITFDHLKVWEIDMDWGTIGNSTISNNPLEIPTDPFDASELFGNGNGALRQPGTAQRLAAHGGIISYNANYREFGTHNSWLITFNTFVDGAQTGGIRWIELRNDGVNPWAIHQEGTYAPNDGHSRVMSSAAMDAAGNIGMAYSIGSTSLEVGLRYTGRFDGDPLGTMTVAETTIIDGGGVRTNAHRYGDYAHMTMDPDNFTFWYTADFFSSNNQWRTQIASFSLSGGFNDDVGINAINTPNNGILTNAETVDVSIRNFGANAQTSIPLELRVDGNLVASETYNGNIAAGGTDTFTFAQTVDLSTLGQTYSIEVKTALVGDEFTPNDTFTKDVTHLLGDDTGVIAITSPMPVTTIGMETVSVTIRNFGATTQSNFDVQYTVDGGTPVIENFAGPLMSGEEFSYDFTQQVDLSVAGTYEIVAKTNLVGDQENSNDSTTLSVTSGCVPEATAGCNLDGIKKFVLNTIDADDGGNGCNTEPPGGPTGYANRTALSTVLSNLAGSNVYTLRAQQNWDGGVGVEALSVWIDFDDNGVFEPAEQLISGEFFTTFNQLEDFTLTIPVGAALGSHVLRAKAMDTSASGDINNPCTDFEFGEVHDYTVDIQSILSVEDQAILAGEFIITSLPNNQYEVSLTTEFEGDAFISVYSLLGQQLAIKSVVKENGSYKYRLDMSSASSGVYLIRMGSNDNNTFQTGKIIVK